MLVLESVAVVIGIIAAFAVLIGILNGIDIIRSRRISKVAKEFGLSFSGGKNLFLTLQSTPTKSNLISGTIKGRVIEAYDLDMTAYRRKTKHEWVLTIDGKDQQTKSFLNIIGLKMPVKKIKEVLSRI
jgi:hypothetical protein